MSDEERRARENARRRERYANDPDFRESKKKRANAFWIANNDRINAARRERYAADPEYRAKLLMDMVTWRYGISRDDFAAMLEAQNHACGICRRAFQRTAHVDHCHITGLVRGLLCSSCNTGLGLFGEDATFLRNAIAYMERWLLHLVQLFNTEENDMTPNDNATEESKASRLMRKAILHELHQPFGLDPPPPTDRLQAIARALVAKAEAQDIQAIKEVLDRIDGKTPSAPTNNEVPKQVNISWKLPPSKLNASHQSSPEPQPKTTRSSPRRAISSSRSMSETSGSPAS
jgi:hypothetical protein